jgi:hypothetical protein
MAEWETNLPPIMREKLARIGKITPGEKERIKDLDRMTSLLSQLSQFYKGELSAEGLWKELKDYKDKGKGYLLKEAQVKLIDSLSLGSAEAEFQKRRDGLLAIESLKEHQNTAMLEQSLNSINGLQTKYRDEMEKTYSSLKSQVERNPQLRMHQVKQGQTTVVVQLTVDEAAKISPEWKRFVASHEKRYGQEFAKTMDRLRREAK